MEAKYVNLNCTISVARNVKVVKRNFCERKAEKGPNRKLVWLFCYRQQKNLVGVRVAV